LLHCGNRSEWQRDDHNESHTPGSWYSSRRINEPCSGFKVLVEDPSGRILGAHVLGHHADAIVNLFALAMRSGTTISTLKDMMFAYPTHGSDLPYML
jgi:glutathione reductase (NADPH)